MDQSRSDYSNNMRRNQHQEYQQKRHPLWLRIIKWLFILIVVLIVIGAALFTYYAATAPKISHSALSTDNSTTIYGANGKVVSRLGAQNREYVKEKDIPPMLKNAVVSIEDRHFYRDYGVDPIRIGEAAVNNVIGRNGIQGGSTLTQQLVKLSVFSTKASDRTLKRKAQEAWLALKVDHDYSKQQILEFYINKVYMGNNAYGMQTASKLYFNKPLSKLNLPQTALLAGMPQAPTQYNPFNNPNLATQRRNQVLNAMESNKVISQAEATEAKATPVTEGLKYKNKNKTSPEIKNEKYADAYISEVINELKRKGYKMNSGLKVYTNLDMNNQKRMYQLANSNNSPVQFPNNQFQLGATMVNSQNGKVVSMIGSRKSKYQFGLNRAVQKDHSSGSTMKPLMDYGPAIQYLYYPTYQPVEDTPFTYPGTNIQLNDFDNKHEGLITMEKALIESRNIPAIRTLQAVGIPRATTFLNGLGMHFKKPLTLQNGIGGYISSEQEAAAYAAFANNGVFHKPYLINKVETANGTVHKYSSKSNQAMNPAVAYMMTQMLKGVMTNPNGSGLAAKIPGLYQAGKTGTTMYPSGSGANVPSDASMDSWFSGYTKNYSLSVWTGYDHPFQPGHYITQPQTEIAQNYYKQVMSQASAGLPNTDWQKPNDVQQNDKGYYVSGHPGTYNSQATGAATQSKQAANGKAVVNDKNNVKTKQNQGKKQNNGKPIAVKPQSIKTVQKEATKIIKPTVEKEPKPTTPKTQAPVEQNKKGNA